MKKIIYLALFLVLYGCASHQAILNSWKSQPSDELIYRWGAPESIVTLEDGRKIITYKHSRLHAGTEMYCIVTFRIGVDGKVDDASYEGNIGGCNRMFGTKPAAN